jgi:hypothetical protein
MTGCDCSPRAKKVGAAAAPALAPHSQAVAVTTSTGAVQTVASQASAAEHTVDTNAVQQMEKNLRECEQALVGMSRELAAFEQQARGADPQLRQLAEEIRAKQAAYQKALQDAPGYAEYQQKLTEKTEDYQFTRDVLELAKAGRTTELNERLRKGRLIQVHKREKEQGQ